MMSVVAIQNGWFIANSSLEATGIPKSISDEDSAASENSLTIHITRILNELNTLVEPDTLSIELLFVGSKMKGDAVRTILTVRAMSQSEQEAIMLSSNVANILKSRLEDVYYIITSLKDSDINSIAEAVPINSAYGLVRNEVYKPDPFTRTLLYWCPTFESQGASIASIIDKLSSTSNAAISIILFPTQLTQTEFGIVSQIDSAFEYSGMSSLASTHDSAFNECNNFFKSISSRRSLLMMCICVFGESSSVIKLASSALSYCNHLSSDKAVSCISVPEDIPSFGLEFNIYPWNILDFLMNNGRISNDSNGVSAINGIKRMPFLFDVNECACLFRLPIGNSCSSGLNVVGYNQTIEALPSSMFNASNVQIGMICGTDRLAGLELSDLTRHAVVVGMPGSGKTTLLLDLLTQLYSKKIPFITIEPSKTEYRSLKDVVDGLKIYTPGNNAICNLPLNPFTPPDNVRLESYIPSLFTAFQASFSMEPPLDSLFMAAIRQTYLDHGWRDNSTSEDSRAETFGLSEFISVFKKLIDESTYSAEVKGNLRSGGVFRLTSLLNQNKAIFDTDICASIADLLSSSTIIELNAIDNQQQKTLVISLLLVKLLSFIKSNWSSRNTLRAILLIDEAHVLLDPQQDFSPAGNIAIAMIQDMIAEMRAYGLGIIISDQTPSRIGNNIIANTDIKIGMRLVQENEKRLFGQSCGLDDSALSYMSSLQPGTLFLHFRKLDKPLLIQSSGAILSKIKSISDAQLTTSLSDSPTPTERPFAVCSQHICCNGCDFNIRNEAEYLSSKIFNDFGKRIIDANSLAKHLISIEMLVKTYSNESVHSPALLHCVAVLLYRKVMLETRIRLPKNLQKVVFNAQ